MGAASASSTYVNNLMFAQGPAFWAGVMENDNVAKIFQRVKNVGNKGVQQDGGKYYWKETVINALGYAGRPMTSEGGARPTAYPATPIIPYHSLTTHWVPVQFTGRAKLQGDLVSNITIGSTEMTNAEQSAAWHLGYALRGSSFGVLDRAIGAGSSGTTIYVHDASVFRVGMYIDSFTAKTSGSTGITDAQITAIDLTNNTLTIAAETWTDKEYITLMDSNTYMGSGIESLVNDGSDHFYNDEVVNLGETTYGAITKSTADNWNSLIRGYGAGQFDPKWLYNFLAASWAWQKHPAGYTAAYCNPMTAAALIAGIPVTERFMSDTKIQYGTDGDITILSPMLKRGKISVVVMPDWRGHSLWFINEDDMGIRYPEEPGWQTDENGNTLKWNGNEYSGYDLWTGSWMATIGVIGHPIEHGILKDIAYLE